MRHRIYHRDATKDLVVACHRAGISFRRMSEGGLPTVSTIRGWKKTDPRFAARLAEYGVPSQFSIDWDRVQQLLLDGHPVSRLSQLFPGMPSESAIMQRALTYPAWYQPIKVLHVKGRREEAQRRSQRKAEILRRLGNGESLQCLVKAGVIARTLIEKWRAKDHRFDGAVRDIIARRERQRTVDRVVARNQRQTEKLARAEQARQRRLRMTCSVDDPIYATAAAAVPRTYPTDVREDIISMIFLDVLEGKIKQSDIAVQAKRVVTAYWRERPEFRAISFDAPISDRGSGMTLHDVLAHPGAAE